MTAVKERDFVLLPEAPLKTGKRQSSFAGQDTGPSGPTQPPDPPRGGNGGNGRFPFFFILLVVALVPYGFSLKRYTEVLGNSGAALVAAYVAWAFIFISGAKCTIWLKEVEEHPETVEHAIQISTERTSRRFWDGLFILLCCFHYVLFADAIGMLYVVEISLVAITLAYFVEKARSRLLPQSVSDAINIVDL
jgi:hypothetical protein